MCRKPFVRHNGKVEEQSSIFFADADLRISKICCIFAALIVFGIYTDGLLLDSKRLNLDRWLVKVGGLFSDFYHPHFYFDYQVLGVPSIALQIILSRATSVGLCRGSQAPHCYTIP